MHLYCLDKAPNPVHLDEPWLSDAALQFLKNGRFGFSIFGDLYGLDKDVGFGNIHLFAEAMMFKLFGFGLYQARLVSFLSGLLLIWFTYLLGKKLYDRKTGIMSAVLFSLSGMFVDVSHFARQEMMLALFMAVSLYLYLLAREKRSKILYFITGLLLALSLDVHPNGVAMIVFIGVLFLWEYKSKVFKEKSFWFILCGLFLGVIYFFGVHRLFLYQWNTEYRSWHRSQAPILVIMNFGEFLRRILVRNNIYLPYFTGGQFHHKIVISLFILFAIASAIYRRREADKILLLISGVFGIFYFLIFANPLISYWIYLYPFFYILISASIFSLIKDYQIGTLKWRTSKKRVYIGLAMLMVILLLGAGRYVKWTYKAFSGSPDARDSYYYYSYLDKLKVHIPENAVVLGNIVWFYGFYRQPYIAIYYFEWVLEEKNEKIRKKHGADFAEAVEKRKIDYIIIDDDFRARMSRGSGIPPDQFFPFLRNKCELVATVMDGYHVGGFTPDELHRTEIYRVKR
ncbi:hypothetical protein ES702_05583 [subsurface metagenome]